MSHREPDKKYKVSTLTLIIIGSVVFISSYTFFGSEFVENNPFIRNEIIVYALYNLVVILTIDKKKT